MTSWGWLVLGCGLVLAATGCGDDGADPLVRRGQTVYLNNCTACHARDPSQVGPVGPPVQGASLELLESKILRNEYPPGHTPKRDSRAMIPLPHLAPDLPALAAFLN